MKKFKGHQRCTHRVVSEHRGGQEGRYDDPIKNKKMKDCQMVRSGQPTGVLIPVVYLFGGEESKAKNSKVAHEYAVHREHDEFILVRASEE
jgi:hypothetical protein